MLDGPPRQRLAILTAISTATARPGQLSTRVGSSSLRTALSGRSRRDGKILGVERIERCCSTDPLFASCATSDAVTRAESLAPRKRPGDPALPWFSGHRHTRRRDSGEHDRSHPRSQKPPPSGPRVPGPLRRHDRSGRRRRRGAPPPVASWRCGGRRDPRAPQGGGRRRRGPARAFARRCPLRHHLRPATDERPYGGSSTPACAARPPATGSGRAAEDHARVEGAARQAAPAGAQRLIGAGTFCPARIAAWRAIAATRRGCA